jgi:hypothetical protein
VSFRAAVPEASCRENSKQEVEFARRNRVARLRRSAFLLNLERANEVDEVSYPVKLLSKEEVALVLSKRVELQYFVT